MKIEEKVVKLSTEDVLTLEEIVMDRDKEQAYEFARKIVRYIEGQEKGHCKPTFESGY